MSKHSTKLIANDIPRLSIYYLNQKKFLNQGLGFSHTISWGDGAGNIKNSLNISIINNEEGHFAILEYLINDDKINQKIYIQSQKCNLGGDRHWFICPVCHSRVGKLFLSGEYFVCRRCGDVTYSSKNINRKSNFFIVFNCINMDKKLRELESKIIKKTYKNKPTKSFQRYLRLYNKLHSYDSLLEKANKNPEFFHDLLIT